MEKASRLDSMLLFMDMLYTMSWSGKACEPRWPQFWRHGRLLAVTGMDPPAQQCSPYMALLTPENSAAGQMLLRLAEMRLKLTMLLAPAQCRCFLARAYPCSGSFVGRH